MISASEDIDELLEVAPDRADYESLWYWIYLKLGLKLAVRPVCPGHTSPYDILHYKYARKPHTILIHGPRGGGKTLGAAIDAHANCRWSPRYAVKILGGSKMQSAQVYEALHKYIYSKRYNMDGRDLGDSRPIKELLKESAEYHNGSSISYLAASPRSVRGPHVPSLKLDEVDEQDPEILSAAVGMVQESEEDGHSPQIEMISTWHRVGGPMTERIGRAEREQIPFFRYCIFEVLQRCPDSMSGRNLEKCPACPIFQHCWAERFEDPTRPPRAKLSNGHYTLTSLIQKVYAISEREFEADYLCLAPRSEGVWFTGYSDTRNVHAEYAEYNPGLNVHVPIDYGVRTYACFFQVRPRRLSRPKVEDICIFAEYFGEGLTPEENALGIRATAERFCNGRMNHITMDSAAKSPEGAGVTGFAEYQRAGFRNMDTWDRVQSRKDNYTLIEAFIKSAAGDRHLFIHPRCVIMRAALMQRRRARAGRQWLDYPAKPQHPEEDVVDALAGGLNRLYPRGRFDLLRKSSLMVPGNVIA